MRPRTGITTVVLTLTAWIFAAAQSATPGVHPISGRAIAQVMGYQGADWLDRNERALEEEPDRALEALDIKRGWSVADVGAGTGYMSVKLARRVGPAGRVYAEDIHPQIIKQ